MTLHEAFCRIPLAHRGLHAADDGRPENSREAMAAAVEAGYGVELDVQISADGVAMVFHDQTLDRMTSAAGAVRDRSAAELAALPLNGGPTGIPTLADILALIAGRVPVLIEIKDQDGALGPNIGPLESAVADGIRGYRGPLAVMSFNPHSVARMADIAPDVVRGLTTCDFAANDWPGASPTTLDHLRAIADFDRVGASFVSHDRNDLTAGPILQLVERDIPVLCWTVRTPHEERDARDIACNITFEGYLP